MIDVARRSGVLPHCGTEEKLRQVISPPPMSPPTRLASMACSAAGEKYAAAPGRSRETRARSARSAPPAAAACRSRSRWERGNRPRRCACPQAREWDRRASAAPAERTGVRRGARAASHLPRPTISSSVPPICTVAERAALRRFPRNRARQRVVDFEHPGAVAIMLQLRRYAGDKCSPAICSNCRGVTSHSARSNLPSDARSSTRVDS